MFVRLRLRTVFAAVKSQRDRRDLFDEFCKEKIREQRAAKKRAAESGQKVDVSVSSRLLSER